MTLVEFIRACLDEDQRVAEAARDSWKGGPALARHSDASVGNVLHVARHVTAWDPARVLAEIAAKRAILDLHSSCGLGYGYCDTHGGVGGITVDGRRYPGCWTAQILAQPCAGRPGWQTDW